MLNSFERKILETCLTKEINKFIQKYGDVRKHIQVVIRPYGGIPSNGVSNYTGQWRRLDEKTTPIKIENGLGNTLNGTQEIGNELYKLVSMYCDSHVGKITGMLLELPINQLKKVMDDSKDLKAMIDEAIMTLEESGVSVMLNVSSLREKILISREKPKDGEVKEEEEPIGLNIVINPIKHLTTTEEIKSSPTTPSIISTKTNRDEGTITEKTQSLTLDGSNVENIEVVRANSVAIINTKDADTQTEIPCLISVVNWEQKYHDMEMAHWKMSKQNEILKEELGRSKEKIANLLVNIKDMKSKLIDESVVIPPDSLFNVSSTIHQLVKDGMIKKDEIIVATKVLSQFWNVSELESNVKKKNYEDDYDDDDYCSEDDY